MKKESFIKLVNAILAAHKRRDTLCEKLDNALRESRMLVSKPDLADLIYDSGLEDDIIEMFELEFGTEGRDKIASYIYEQMDIYYNTSAYPHYDGAGDLYDDIMKNTGE